jgi:hypothetical protein
MNGRMLMMLDFKNITLFAMSTLVLTTSSMIESKKWMIVVISFARMISPITLLLQERLTTINLTLL